MSRPTGVSPAGSGRTGLGATNPIVLFFLGVLIGCAEESERPPASPEDTTAPAAIEDLRVTTSRPTFVIVSWTAPAEDGATGGAVSSYDLRVRADSVDAETWDLADRAVSEPTPSLPGETEIFLLERLRPDSPYGAAVRSIDDAGLLSPLSNVIRFRTRPEGVEVDTIAPAAVVDLMAVAVGETVVDLRWTATGDDDSQGWASRYDLRRRAWNLSDASWSVALVLEGEPVPGRAGTIELLTVDGLYPAMTYAFGMRVLDEAGNESDLSNVVAVTTQAGEPEFIDPRGLDAHPTIRELYVADHADSSVSRIGMLGSKSRIATVPGALGLVRSRSTGIFYVIAGFERSNHGSLWFLNPQNSDLILIADGFAVPSDIAVDPYGNLLVAVEEPGSVLRFSPIGTGPEILVETEDERVTGVTVDGDGNVYYGVVGHGEDWSTIRRRGVGGATTDLHHAAHIGDLVDDPAGRGVWYLDALTSAVLRLSYDGDDLDTLATGLLHPVAVTPASSEPDQALYYSSRDGHALLIELRQ